MRCWGLRAWPRASKSIRASPPSPILTSALHHQQSARNAAQAMSGYARRDKLITVRACALKGAARLRWWIAGPACRPICASACLSRLASPRPEVRHWPGLPSHANWRAPWAANLNSPATVRRRDVSDHAAGRGWHRLEGSGVHKCLPRTLLLTRSSYSTSRESRSMIGNPALSLLMVAANNCRDYVVARRNPAARVIFGVCVAIVAIVAAPFVYGPTELARAQSLKSALYSWRLRTGRS